MKKVLHISIILLCMMNFHCAVAQTNEDYFLLGTFSDYAGYYSIDTTNCEVDHYDYHEKKLADYIRSSVTRRYGGEVRMKKIPNRYHLYSYQQYQVLTSLYRQTNNLQENNFTTREQELSYLHGVYLRFCVPLNDTLYIIRVHNSNHGRLFYKVAQPLGFTNMKVEERNTIPHTTLVYFTPTAEFLEFIRPTEALKKKLLADEDKFFRKVLGLSKKEFEELKKKSQEQQPINSSHEHLASLVGNTQDSSGNLLNERWEYQSYHPIGISSTQYYFTADSKFYCNSEISAGKYQVDCIFGTYSYNSSNNEITLNIEESYTRGHDGDKTDFTKSVHKINITSITDSIVVIDEVWEDMRVSGWEFRRYHCRDAEMFALPGVRTIVAVEGMTISEHNSKQSVKVNDDDRKELLSIIRSARYDRTSTPTDYYPSELIMASLHLNETKMDVIIGMDKSSKPFIIIESWEFLRYEIDATAGNRLIELLKKYVP